MKRYRQSKVVLTEYQVLSEMREDPEGDYFLVRDVQKRDMVYDERADELRSEVERLRAKTQKNANCFEHLSDAYLGRAERAESRLAAANALLEYCAADMRDGPEKQAVLAHLAAPSCDECGSTGPTHQSHHAGRLCDDVTTCRQRAEVERLRAELNDLRELAGPLYNGESEARIALESSLAAANALLAKLAVVAVRGIPELLCNLILETRAHLALQKGSAK